MDFTLDAGQQQFGAALHELLTAADCPSAIRARAAGDREPGLKLWQSLAASGVTALVVPDEFGGLGGSPADLVVACEEIGHHAIPGPVAESLAAVPVLLAAAAGPDGLPELRQELAGALGALAAGQFTATLACPPLLPYAADADATGLVLLAEPDALQAGQPGPVLRSVHAARTLTEVTGGRVLAEGPAYQRAAIRAADFGTLANSAQLLGAGRALLEASARHARERIQFGRPVGSFQAVKHLLADVLIGLEFARPLLDAAAVAIGTSVATAPRDVSAAKVACAGAAYRAARVALQVHGAIGYTAEHDAGLWITLIQALRPAWGSESWHKARVLSAVTAETGS